MKSREVIREDTHRDSRSFGIHDEPPSFWADQLRLIAGVQMRHKGGHARRLATEGVEFIAPSCPVVALGHPACLEFSPVGIILGSEGTCPGEGAGGKSEGTLTHHAEFKWGQQDGTAEVENESGQWSSSEMVTMV